MTCAGLLLCDTELFHKWRDRVGVDRGVVVHGDLDDRNGAQIHPFLPCRPVVSQDLVGIVLGQLALAIGAHLFIVVVVLVRRSDSLIV